MTLQKRGVGPEDSVQHMLAAAAVHLGHEHLDTLIGRNNLATVETALANASTWRPWLPLPPCTGECDVWAGLADGQRERLEAVGGTTTSSPRAATEASGLPWMGAAHRAERGL